MSRVTDPRAPLKVALLAGQIGKLTDTQRRDRVIVLRLAEEHAEFTLGQARAALPYSERKNHNAASYVLAELIEEGVLIRVGRGRYRASGQGAT
jgi:hypothetical protein